MKKVCIMTFAAVVLIAALLFIFWPEAPSQYMEKIVGTWLIYEGGNVAPDVLSFCDDGTGQAYTLNESYPDTNQAPAYMTEAFLMDPCSFSWNIQKGDDSQQYLTLAFENGENERFRVTIGPESNGWTFLSLYDGEFGGGWIPAQIIRQKIVGSWMIYEGGNVAPDVLTFCGDGTGQAYTLNESYPDTNQAPAYIEEKYLMDPCSFSWNIQKGDDSQEYLTLAFENGENERFRFTIGPSSNGWILLSLHESFGGGGWIPAQIVQ